MTYRVGCGGLPICPKSEDKQNKRGSRDAALLAVTEWVRPQPLQ